MTTTEKVLFTGRTHTTGGRDGATRSSDGFVDLKLPQPHPAAEQLFAAAWSACYMARSSSPQRRGRSSCRPPRLSMPRSS
jgi:organic hydroperoxide reductase OsmC/OhrA